MGLPDCAAAYLACCQEAGLLSTSPAAAEELPAGDKGGVDAADGVSSKSSTTTWLERSRSEGEQGADAGGAGDEATGGLQEQQGVQLFDVLAAVGVPDWGARRARGNVGSETPREAHSGVGGGAGSMCKVSLVQAEFERYVVKLLQYL